MLNGGNAALARSRFRVADEGLGRGLRARSAF